MITQVTLISRRMEATTVMDTKAFGGRGKKLYDRRKREKRETKEGTVQKVMREGREETGKREKGNGEIMKERYTEIEFLTLGAASLTGASTVFHTGHHEEPLQASVSGCIWTGSCCVRIPQRVSRCVRADTHVASRCVRIYQGVTSCVRTDVR